MRNSTPGLKLPAQNIAVVRRADGSGTSFVFSYTAKVNEEWKSKVGSGSTVNWPTGLGGKGNDGIAAFVQRLPGSIGYVEYAYAKQNNCTPKLLSADGKAVSPTETNFSPRKYRLSQQILLLGPEKKARMCGQSPPPPSFWCIKSRLNRSKALKS